MSYISEARKLRLIIEQAATSLDDKTASAAAALFPQMQYDGSLIPAGTRINWNGTIKKATADMWDTEANSPDNAPIMWEDIEYKLGYRLIPETITVTTAFEKDEIGWWKDQRYKSLLEANVYNPEQYPTGWELSE